jgi:pimeloyl-ACP methyl ester carboxylesterase
VILNEPHTLLINLHSGATNDKSFQNLEEPLAEHGIVQHNVNRWNALGENFDRTKTTLENLTEYVVEQIKSQLLMHPDTTIILHWHSFGAKLAIHAAADPIVQPRIHGVITTCSAALWATLSDVSFRSIFTSDTSIEQLYETKIAFAKALSIPVDKIPDRFIKEMLMFIAWNQKENGTYGMSRDQALKSAKIIKLFKNQTELIETTKEALSQINKEKVPIYAIYGEHDTIVSADTLYDNATQMWVVDYHIMDDGHTPHIQHQDEFTKILLEFIEDIATHR